MNTDYALYLDLDGVLIDPLHSMAKTISKEGTKFYKNSNKIIQFWSTLDWIRGGKEVWENSKKLFKNIMILSSAGIGTSDSKKFSSVAEGKIKWCKKNLSITEDDIIIVDDQEMKKIHSHIMGILVDGRESCIVQWESVGGTGIMHHCKCFEKTIEELEFLSKPINLTI